MMNMIPDLHNMSLMSRFIYGSLSFITIMYFMFQKKMFSKQNTQIVSAIFFYPTFPITALLRLGNYWTKIDDVVVLGCAPMSLPFGIIDHPSMLYKLGVRGVINMCTEYSGPVTSYQTLGMEQLRLPTVDHFEPTVDQFEEAVLFIEKHRSLGNKVYVHCKAGHGRAASVVQCWLMTQNKHMTSKEVNAMLVSKRKVRGTLYKQMNVSQFYENIQNKSKMNTIDKNISASEVLDDEKSK